MTELKICPFCGGKAKIVQTGYGTTMGDGSCRLAFAVQCTKCEATAPSASGYIAINLGCDGDLNPWHDDRPSAIEAWNRRAGDTNA